jgi:predicted lipopolysaccharide heptosyltransferase III
LDVGRWTACPESFSGLDVFLFCAVSILVIQLKRIGDLILTTPAIAALREKFPEARIDLVVSPAGAELTAAIPGVDRIFIAGRRLADVATWLAIAFRRYDYCLDFTRTDRSALLTILSHARKRITYERANAPTKWRPLVYDEFIKGSARSMHTVDHHLTHLTSLGIRDHPPSLALQLPNESRVAADRILAKAGIPPSFVIFHPGSARIEKFWKAERWAELINHFSESGFTCVLSGGRSEMEQTHIAVIKGSLHRPVVDLSGQVDLLTLTAIIAKALLLVGVDSAPTHLAAAMHTPQVILYGPTNPFHWRPRESPAVILHGDATPPRTTFSPDEPQRRMSDISTKQVIDAMDSLLSTPAASPL